MTLVRYYPNLKKVYREISENDLWNPAVDIIEDNDVFILELDLPGLEKNDFTITVKEDVLVVSGERKRKKPEEEKHYH